MIALDVTMSTAAAAARGLTISMLDAAGFAASLCHLQRRLARRIHIQVRQPFASGVAIMLVDSR